MRVTTIGFTGNISRGGSNPMFREEWYGYNGDQESTTQDWKQVEAIGAPLVALAPQGDGSLGDTEFQLTDAGLFVVTAWLPAMATMPENDDPNGGRVATLDRYVSTALPGSLNT